MAHMQEGTVPVTDVDTKVPHNEAQRVPLRPAAAVQPAPAPYKPQEHVAAPQFAAAPAATRTPASAGAQPTGKQERERKFLGGLLEGLSVPQVAAGALAAVTSMLLSSKIGIAGSVIGVAVGSVVSTLSSQIYKQFLQASADKLRELSPLDDGEQAAQETAAGAFANTAAGATRVMDPAATRVMSQTGGAAETQLIDSALTRVMPGKRTADAAAAPEGAGETRVMSELNGAAASVAAETPTRSVRDLRAAGETGVLRGRAEHLRKQRVQRGVIAVSVVSALVAVLISAGIINLVTAGEGVGTKTEPLFTSTSTSQSADTAASSSKQNQSSEQSATSPQQNESTASTSANPVHQDDSASSDNASASNGTSSGSSTDAAASTSEGANAGSTTSSSGSSTGSGASTSGSGSQTGSSTSGSSNGSSSASGTSAGGSSTSGSSSTQGSSSTGSASGTGTNAASAS